LFLFHNLLLYLSGNAYFSYHTLFMDLPHFPPFCLARLLRNTFRPRQGERVCILIDLPAPDLAKGWGFLGDEGFSIQRHAHDSFYNALHAGVMTELGLTGGEFFAYEETGGSNLDLPDRAVAPDGTELSLERDVYPNYDIILCISTYSATAPLTALAKRHGFRGATLHGVNDIILRSGLAVDYNEVSLVTEKLRLALTRADWFEIDFKLGDDTHTLRLECSQGEAQKSHGICLADEPDVANLPAGEVYFVPTGGNGAFPMQYADGTLGLQQVNGGSITRVTLIRGDQAVIDAHNAKLADDPVTGELGELGFGTQVLPVSGRDIQDEKILGTMHVATGRSDHLGGDLTPDKFAKAQNATHDDILFSPSKTPDITVSEVRMQRDGGSIVVLESYQPAEHLLRAIG
jgi:aminopeptidase